MVRRRNFEASASTSQSLQALRECSNKLLGNASVSKCTIISQSLSAELYEYLRNHHSARYSTSDSQSETQTQMVQTQTRLLIQQLQQSVASETANEG